MIAFVRGVMRRSICSGSMLQVVGADVGQHRRGAGVDDDVGGRGEGQRRRDHLVAGADAAASSARCMPAVQELTATACSVPAYSRNSLLEALRLGAVDQPAGAQRIDDLGDVVFAEVGFGDGKEVVCQAVCLCQAFDGVESSFVIAACGAARAG